jgi:hypothetical protein
MLKLATCAVVSAAFAFAVAAATGLGATPHRVAEMKVGDIVDLKSANFHCQVLTTTQVACGANSLPNSVQVFFVPHQIAVVKFDKTGKKYAITYQVKR